MAIFLFWNLARKAPTKLIGQACRDHDVDILILAECGVPGNELLAELNSRGEFRFFQPPGLSASVAFFLRLPPASIRPVFDSSRISIQSITPPVGTSLIVAACHLPSKLYDDHEDQSFTLRQLRREIDAAEKNAGHKNTMIIGDLNLDPFDQGMRSVDGLHAVMDKRIAQRKPRTYKGQEWDYFYNPMWSRLGDESVGPPGTYYHSGGGISDPYWHTLDQLLLRPTLLKYYDKQKLHVLTEIGAQSLLGTIGPDHAISDHLPLVINLEIEEVSKMSESFWAIPRNLEVRTPVQILREQAAALTEKTEGRLRGDVGTFALDKEITLTMNIYVPALSNYKVEALEYRQPIEMYPGILTLNFQQSTRYKVTNEIEFVAAVRGYLSSNEMARVIQSLMAQGSWP